MNRICVALVALASLGFVSSPAFAGRSVDVDFAPPSGNVADSNYAFDGQFWNRDYATNTNAVNGGFIPLNFGSGAPASRLTQLDPAGRILFVDSSGNPTGDFINVMFTSAAYRTDPGYQPTSRIGVASGYLDPAILTALPNFLGTYDFNNALPAFRFNWQDTCTLASACNGSGNGLVTFQAVLVALGNDSFLLQYNYGFNGNNVPSGATAGFSLGGNSASFAAPTGNIGPDYCFSRGVVSNFTTIAACTNAVAAVPEPTSIALMFLGLAMLFGVSTRRSAKKAVRFA